MEDSKGLSIYDTSAVSHKTQVAHGIILSKTLDRASWFAANSMWRNFCDSVEFLDIASTNIHDKQYRKSKELLLLLIRKKYYLSNDPKISPSEKQYRIEMLERTYYKKLLGEIIMNYQRRHIVPVKAVADVERGYEHLLTDNADIDTGG